MTLFDEAHHCSADIMSNVLQDCEKKQKCGVIYYFSATPENINRKNAKNFKYSFEDAIRNHLIRSYKVHIIFHTKKDSLLDQVRRINNGQFQKILAFTQYTQHENLPENRHNVNDIVEEWKDDDKGYCVFGLSSDNTPSDDRETIKSFEKSTEENGLLSILVSCRKLGEGIDIKSVNSVMFIDPKKTTKDIYQIIGRGLRLFRDPKTGEPLEWSKQTPCNIILNVSIDISKIDEKNPYGFFLKTGDSEKFSQLIRMLILRNPQYNHLSEEYIKQALVENFKKKFNTYIEKEINEKNFGIFESVIHVITALKLNMEEEDQRSLLNLNMNNNNKEFQEYTPDSSTSTGDKYTLDGLVDSVIEYANYNSCPPEYYISYDLYLIWQYVKNLPEYHPLQQKCIRKSETLSIHGMVLEEEDIDNGSGVLDQENFNELEKRVVECIRKLNDEELSKNRHSVNMMLDDQIYSLIENNYEVFNQVCHKINQLDVTNIFIEKQKKRKLVTVTNDEIDDDTCHKKQKKTVKRDKNNKI